MLEENNLEKQYQKREEKRKSKRLAIIAFPILIILLALILIFFLSRPGPTCFDEIQNGEEERIDCGGPCEPCSIKYAAKLEAISLQVLESDNDFSQAIIKIKNSNPDLVAEFKYKGILKDEAGKELVSFAGKSFIYPSSVKYIIEPKINTPSLAVQGVGFEISEEKWFLTDYGSGRFFSVSETKVEKTEEKDQPGYLKVSGKIANQSGRDFEKVDLAILVYSKTGSVLNGARTQIFGLNAGEIQDFQYTFLNSFPGLDQVDLKRAEVYADALAK